MKIALTSWPARKGQQRSFRRMRQPFRNGVRAFAGAAELRVSGVGRLLRLRLVLPLVRHQYALTCTDVGLIGQGDQSGGGQSAR